MISPLINSEAGLVSGSFKNAFSVRGCVDEFELFLGAMMDNALVSCFVQ